MDYDTDRKPTENAKKRLHRHKSLYKRLIHIIVLLTIVLANDKQFVWNLFSLLSCHGNSNTVVELNLFWKIVV